MASLILKVHLEEHEMLSHCLQNMFFKQEFIIKLKEVSKGQPKDLEINLPQSTI